MSSNMNIRLAHLLGQLRVARLQALEDQPLGGAVGRG